jgi:hypothetical protein
VESGEALHLEALSKSFVLGGVDLGDVQVLLGEDSGGGLVLGVKLLAVTAKSESLVFENRNIVCMTDQRGILGIS